jgi:uncharacterized protein YutE (UPF0331/DUF86 family)
MHVTGRRELGVPQETRDVFTILHDAGVIDAELCDRVQWMVGLRNLASIVRDRLADFTAFTTAVLEFDDSR